MINFRDRGQRLLGDVPERFPPAPRQSAPGHLARRFRHLLDLCMDLSKGQKFHTLLDHLRRQILKEGTHGVYIDELLSALVD